MKFFIYIIAVLISYGYPAKAALDDLGEPPVPHNAIAQVGIQCDDATYFFDCWLPKRGYLAARDKLFIMMPGIYTDEIPELATVIAGTLAGLTDTYADDGKVQILNQVTFALNPPPPLPVIPPVPLGLPLAIIPEGGALPTIPGLSTSDSESAAQGG